MTIVFEPWMALVAVTITVSCMAFIGHETWGRGGKLEWLFVTVIGGWCLGLLLNVILAALSVALLFGLGFIK